RLRARVRDGAAGLAAPVTLATRSWADRLSPRDKHLDLTELARELHRLDARSALIGLDEPLDHAVETGIEVVPGLLVAHRVLPWRSRRRFIRQASRRVLSKSANPRDRRREP